MFNRKKFLKQLLGYMPSQIIPAFSNLGIILILTRYLSIEGYGFYSLLMTTVGLAVSIFTQWMMQSILFFRPKYKVENRLHEFNYYISKIYLLLSVISFFIFLISITLFIFIEIEIAILVPIMLIFLFNCIFIINQSILQSDMKVGKYSFYVSFSSIIKLVLISLISLYFKADINVILWAIAFSFFLVVIPEIFKLIQLKNKQKEVNSGELNVFLLSMLQYGLPMLGWFLATSLINITDRYVLAIFTSTTEVGLYSANVAIVASALGLVFAPFIKAIHPIIMNTSRDDNNDKEVSNLMSKFSVVFIAIGLPVIISIIILRQEISELLLGADYVEGSIIIPFILGGLFLWNLAMIGHKGFEVKKDTKHMFYYVLIACLLNLILNFVLIPSYEILGAGIASLISYGIYPIFIFIYSNKNIKWIMSWKKIFLLICIGLIVFVVSNSMTNSLYVSSLIIHILLEGTIILTLYLILLYISLKILRMKIL